MKIVNKLQLWLVCDAAFWASGHAAKKHAAVVLCGVPLAVAVMEYVMVRQRCMWSRGSMRLQICIMQ